MKSRCSLARLALRRSLAPVVDVGAGFLTSLITGFFADGTNYAPGGLAVVGEEGPELVNLPRGSQVIPNDRIGGSTFNINTSIDARGADAAAAARIERALAEQNRRLPELIRRTVQDGQARGTL